MFGSVIDLIAHNIVGWAGGLLCICVVVLLTYQDFSSKLDADEYNNFLNPLFHFKSLIWFFIVGSIATAVYVFGLNSSSVFFETISFGQSNPIARGFLNAFVVVAILKSSFTTSKEIGQLGIDTLYSFIQSKFVNACRRDSILARNRIVDAYKGKFCDDDSFPDFLQSVVDSEIRSLPYKERRKSELKEQFSAVMALVRTVGNDKNKRSIIYDQLLSTCLTFCSLTHIQKLLEDRSKNYTAIES